MASCRLSLVGVTAALLWTAPATAQTAIRAHPVNDRVTLLVPNEGSGTTIVVRGSDGVFIVDTMDDTVGTHFLSALRELGVERARFLVNTHWHHNHLGGNRLLAGATILGTDAMRRRLSTEQRLEFLVQRTYPARPAADLPTRLFADTMSVEFNGERVRLRAVRGHTDTDVIVYFPVSGVVALGDLVSIRGWVPADLDTGGDMLGVYDALREVATTLPPETVVVAGHGMPGTMADLQRYVERLGAAIAYVRDARAQGRSLAEIQSGTWPDDVRQWLGPRGGRMMEAIYRSLP